MVESTWLLNKILDSKLVLSQMKNEEIILYAYTCVQMSLFARYICSSETCIDKVSTRTCIKCYITGKNICKKLWMNNICPVLDTFDRHENMQHTSVRETMHEIYGW